MVQILSESALGGTNNSLGLKKTHVELLKKWSEKKSTLAEVKMNMILGLYG